MKKLRTAMFCLATIAYLAIILITWINPTIYHDNPNYMLRTIFSIISIPVYLYHSWLWFDIETSVNLYYWSRGSQDNYEDAPNWLINVRYANHFGFLILFTFVIWLTIYPIQV